MQDPDRVTDLLLTLRDAGIHLTELSVQKPTLDEVFLTLTGHGVEADDTDAGASDTDRRLEGSRA
jgi:ABC-2 type transport system ATP-binding protein